MKLVLSRRATRRLVEIADYIHARNPTAAGDVQRAIRDAFALLTAYPYAGRSVQPTVRVFAVPRLPYLIYYQIDEATDVLTIITVRHTARRRLL